MKVADNENKIARQLALIKPLKMNYEFAFLNFRIEQALQNLVPIRELFVIEETGHYCK